jgi:hypothetical protein
MYQGRSTLYLPSLILNQSNSNWWTGRRYRSHLGGALSVPLIQQRLNLCMNLRKIIERSVRDSCLSADTLQCPPLLCEDGVCSSSRICRDRQVYARAETISLVKVIRRFLNNMSRVQAVSMAAWQH